MSKIRIALIGCGRISKNHLEAIYQLSDVSELIAVCDVSSERAEIAGKRYGVPWYTDYDKMLSEISCDLVSVCTPSGLHPQHGIAAAKTRACAYGKTHGYKPQRCG